MSKPTPIEARMRQLHPAALAALKEMRHIGGKHATARTLVVRYLYDEPEDGIPDESVRGLCLEERLRLVSEALVEYASQDDTFHPRHFRGFVRRARTAPRPGTEAHVVAQRGEPNGYRAMVRKPSELARVTALDLAKMAGLRPPSTRSDA